MRVLLLVTDFERGGAPIRIAGLARGLRAEGLTVLAGCLAPPGPVSRELDEVGVPTFACEARGPSDICALKRLVQHVRRFEPDLIHATLTHANVAARLAGWELGIPVVTSTATVEVERRRHLTIERLTAWLDRGHIVNSRTLAEHVERVFRVPRQKIHIVPPSIESVPSRMDRAAARRRFGIADHEFAVVWAGRFDPVKRLDLIVQCAQRLHDAPFRFILAGEGRERTKIEQLVGELHVSDSIQLPGWLDDLGPLFSAADAFVFPSLTEGMPNALLAALAFGLPVVGSDIPVLQELSQTGSAGVPPAGLLLVRGGQPGVLADALLRLRKDAALRRAIGERAATWARRSLDPRATVLAVMAVYAHLLTRR